MGNVPLVTRPLYTPGTSAARVLRMIATDRMQAARIATGGKDAHVVPRVYGRVGYDVPVAQSATFRLKQYDTQ